MYLLTFIETLEEALDVIAKKKLLSTQAGDAPAKYADVNALGNATAYELNTSIKEGSANFASCFKDYYKV